MKAAMALGIKCATDDLTVICSGGRVPDLPICGKPWTLGTYIQHNGGTSNRSRRLWGLHISSDDDSIEESEESSSMLTHDSVMNHALLQFCEQL